MLFRSWLNEALFRLRFFQTLERMMTAATGMVPREDDIGKGAALAVARLPPPPLPSLDLPGMGREHSAKPEV